MKLKYIEVTAENVHTFVKIQWEESRSGSSIWLAEEVNTIRQKLPRRGPLLRERHLKAIHNRAMELWVVWWITVKRKIPLSPTSAISLVTVVADLIDLEYKSLSTIPLVVTEN